MFGSLFDSTTIPVLEQVARFTQARHKVLAGNIANADTPGYRVRDLSPETFQARLKEAIERRNEPQFTSPSDAVLIDDPPPGDPLTEVNESMRTILYHDQSDVGLEQQVTEMAKNQGDFNMAIALMRSQFNLMQAAISERA